MQKLRFERRYEEAEKGSKKKFSMLWAVAEGKTFLEN